jgi:membrane-associated phospholipid phosphatase
VPDLTTGLPVGGSWPSGHSAAAMAAYGALAAVVILRSRNRWRWAFLAFPVLLPPLIGLSRVYAPRTTPRTCSPA